MRVPQITNPATVSQTVRIEPPSDPSFRLQLLNSDPDSPGPATAPTTTAAPRHRRRRSISGEAQSVPGIAALLSYGLGDGPLAAGGVRVKLGPGEARQVLVHFNPTSKPNRRRSVQLRVSHAFGSFAMSLSGVGVSADLHVEGAVAAPSTTADGVPNSLLEFGSVPTAATHAKAIVLVNKGLVATVSARTRRHARATATGCHR